MSEYLKDQAPNLDEVVSKMEAEGFRFSRFQLAAEDPCLPVDVEWNYKDMVHVGFVHSHMARKFMYIGKDAYTTFDLQKVLGITIPQSAAFYVTHDNRIIVNTVLFLYVIIVEIHPVLAGEMLTRTMTRYAIGARSSLLRMFIPLLWCAIRSNWQKFTSDDRSLRRRRGDLRIQGYEYTDTSPIDHRETLRITEKGVIALSDRPHYRSEVRLSGSQPLVQTVGSDDHLGIQVIADSDNVRIFPRICPHRGASLDAKDAHGNSVECPWHGRKLRALASFSRNSSGEVFDGPFHRCAYKAGILTIETKLGADNTADWSDAWRKS